MSDLTLLTTTGERYEAWKICMMLMHRQTYTGSVRWVIVDDGKVQQPATFNRENWKIEIVRPEPFWKNGMNTQARNILAGLSIIQHSERVVIIEDDDWYNQKYLECVDKWFESSDMAGEAPGRYFNIGTGCGKVLQNYRHSSLCSTAVKGQALKMLRAVSKQQLKFIDILLWKNYTGYKRLFNSRMMVGIKGIPGRHGIGSGHNPKFGEPMNLSDWIGEDIEIYKNWMVDKVTPERFPSVN